MIFSNQRQDIRLFFFETWRKYNNQHSLEPLEQQLIAIILQHSEYHYIFDNPEEFIDRDYSSELGETNPFLHLALHQAIQDQITTNRPAGITSTYQALVKKIGDTHSAEHKIMSILVEALYQAQKQGSFDEKIYLENIQQLLKN